MWSTADHKNEHGEAHQAGVILPVAVGDALLTHWPEGKVRAGHAFTSG